LIDPDAVIAQAESYRRHIWLPSTQNVFHGQDRNGVQVDTPDVNFRPADKRGGFWVPGQLNVGVPYKWGGFDSIADFDAGIKNGKFAGDITTKRHLENGVSSQAVGVDCSGFVSRCLGLPRQYSTYELPELMLRLPNAERLQKADLVIKPHAHCMVFLEFDSSQPGAALVYEAGARPDAEITWPVGRVTLSRISIPRLLSSGYEMYRFG
jgi:hypothetical protein